MSTFTGWRYAVLVGTVVGGIGAAIYPIIIQPYLHPEEWQKVQKEARQGLDNNKFHTGGMKGWTDPFERKK